MVPALEAGRLTFAGCCGQLDPMDQLAQIAESSPSSNRRRWLLAVALLGVLLTVLALNRWGGAGLVEVAPGKRAGDPPAAGDPVSGVTLTRRGVGVPAASLVVPHWREMTVLDALTAAAEVDRDWHFRYQRYGEQVLVTELAGQSNRGSGQPNWQYEVNRQSPQVGVGAYRLSPGDRVLWKFAPYE